MANTAELTQEDKQKLLQGSSNIKSGVASLVKGDTLAKEYRPRSIGHGFNHYCST